MGKPIIASNDCNGDLLYKYTRKAYVGDFAVEFFTDLTEDQFDKLFDGGFTQEQIERYEETGLFNNFEQ